MIRVIAFQVLVLACLLRCGIAAERPILKPQDFRPLTELPWKKEGATREGIMDTIFREPDSTIRYMVLQLYVHEIPVEEIGRVFDLAIELEGSETPDALVESMLRVWAARDPFRCWERVQKLFLVVGLEDEWLRFDDWDVKRSSMLVQDRAAIQASPFRLRRWSIVGFPAGVERSELPSTERVRLLKEFVQRWFLHFDTYPDSFQPILDARENHTFLEAFKVDADGAQTFYEQNRRDDRDLAAVNIALRRWMVAEPARTPYIMGLMLSEQPYSYHDYERINEFLRLWAEVDRAGVMKWADSKETPKRMAISARGLLMSEVDPATRDRWISEARGREKEDDDLTELQLESWAVWDPKAALGFAVQTGGTEFINGIATAAVEGPYSDPMRPMRIAFDVVRDFDLRALPREAWEGLLEDWGLYPMENWGAHDAGATARFGFAQLEKYEWYGAKREELIDFFAGKNNEFRDGGGVVDRTFCSARVWAATKPIEMKAWVATLKDDKLREALTWLADNPWGPGRF